MTTTQNIALSGSYTAHYTQAAYGTHGRRVRAMCGQSTTKNYLRVVDPANVDETLAHPIVKKCGKCFGV